MNISERPRKQERGNKWTEIKELMREDNNENKKKGFSNIMLE